MNNPKVTLFLGYVLVGCGLLIAFIRLASMFNLFGINKIGSTFTSLIALIFVILGIVIIKKVRKNN